MDLEETLVAQEFATSSTRLSVCVERNIDAKPLTCSIVEGIEHGKKGADHENVGVLVQHLEEQSNITQERSFGSGY